MTYKGIGIASTYLGDFIMKRFVVALVAVSVLSFGVAFAQAPSTVSPTASTVSTSTSKVKPAKKVKVKKAKKVKAAKVTKPAAVTASPAPATK
jgi:hypothetical protein